MVQDGKVYMDVILYLGIAIAGILLIWLHTLGLTRFIGKLFLLLGWVLITFGAYGLLDIFLIR